MPQRRIREASFQWVGPTRVVVERSKLLDWNRMAQFSPARDGFLILQCHGSIDEILVECQRVAPCVFVVTQESIEKLDRGQFSASVGVGASIRVLVVGGQNDPDRVEKWLCMGCMGYLPHDVSRATLRKAVRAIASGEVWARREAVSRAVRKLILRQLVQEMTVREREILRLITSGLSNRAIADRLCITHETVRWHIRSLYSKIGVRDRLSAIVYGRRLLDSGAGGMPREAGGPAAEAAPHLTNGQAAGPTPQQPAMRAAGGQRVVWSNLFES